MLGGLLAAAAVGAAPDSLSLVVSNYAEVSGDRSAREVARRVAALVDQAVPSIAPLVGTTDLRPVRAVIYVDRGAFLSATGIPRRATIVGLATFPAAVIHLDGTERLASIERIVPHEVAHVMVARVMGPALSALPAWVNEGVAEYASGERSSQVDPATLEAVGRGEFLPLSQLDEKLSQEGGGRSLAYTEAASLVNFLVAARGPEVIASLLAATRARGDFDQALRQATGWGEGELESAWRQSLAQRWRWPLLLRSPVLPFGLMLAIFIAGYLRYRRERRRRQEMKERDW